MLPTFELNTAMEGQYERIDKVIKLLKGVDKYSNTGYLGDAFIQIVEGKTNIENIDLSKYSKVMERVSRLKRAEKAKKEVSIITSDELLAGYNGVLVDNIISVFDEDIETIGVEEEFLDIREKVMFTEGKDIWRLIELVKLGSLRDAKDLNKLLKLVEDYHQGTIEIVNLILTKENIYNKLSKKLR